MNLRLPTAMTVFVSICMVGLQAVAALEPVAAFEQANWLYEQGKFAEAAAAYETLRAARVGSPALLFNLGNAYFKAGETGRAIAAFLEAERLTPRDPDVNANLRFARETANARVTQPVWRRALRSLSLNEWTILAATAAWLWLALLTATKLRPTWARPLQIWQRLGLAWLLVSCATLGAACNDRFGQRPAVIVAKEAVVRYGPLEESQSHYTLRDGAEVNVLDSNQGWVQISDAQNRVGWVKQEQLVEVGAQKPR
jgi:hypothetical protein